MTNKEEALQYIKMIAKQNLLSKDEVTLVFDNANINQEPTKSSHKLAELLCYIGGGVIFLGIVISLGQNWERMNILTKLLSTIGSAFAAQFVGIMLSPKNQTTLISNALLLISGLLMPIGLFAILEIVNIRIDIPGAQSLISGVLLASYLLYDLFLRRNIFTLFTIIFGTWFYFSFSIFLMGDSHLFDNIDIYSNLMFSTGIAYLCIGRALSITNRAPVSGFLYGFGVLATLLSALILGKWEPNQSIFWELSYPLFVFGAIYLSVYLKNKAILTLGTLFLMAYLFKITTEYFSNSMGWPITLVVAGVLIIACGYASLSIKQKYL